MKRHRIETAPEGKCFALLDLRRRIHGRIAAAILPGRWLHRAEAVAAQGAHGGPARAAVVLVDQISCTEVL